MEERVEASADHDPLGQPRDETAAHRGQDQRQSRRDAGEVRPCVTGQQRKEEEEEKERCPRYETQVVSTRQHLDKTEVQRCKSKLRAE